MERTRRRLLPGLPEAKPVVSSCHFHPGDEDLGHVHCEECRKEQTEVFDFGPQPVTSLVDDVGPCTCHLCEKREQGVLTNYESWAEYLEHSRARWREAAKQRVKDAKVGGGRKNRTG